MFSVISCSVLVFVFRSVFVLRFDCFIGLIFVGVALAVLFPIAVPINNPEAKELMIFNLLFILAKWDY